MVKPHFSSSSSGINWVNDSDFMNMENQRFESSIGNSLSLPFWKD